MSETYYRMTFLVHVLHSALFFIILTKLFKLSYVNVFDELMTLNIRMSHQNTSKSEEYPTPFNVT